MTNETPAICPHCGESTEPMADDTEIQALLQFVDDENRFRQLIADYKEAVDTCRYICAEARKGRVMHDIEHRAEAVVAKADAKEKP